MSEYDNMNSTTPVSAPAAQKKKKKHTALKVIAIILAVCLVGGLAAIGGYTVYDKVNSQGLKASVAGILEKETEETEKNDNNGGLQIAESHSTTDESEQGLKANGEEDTEAAAPAVAKSDDKEETVVVESADKPDSSSDSSSISAITESSSGTASAVMSPSEIYEANVGSTVGITVSGTVNYWGYTSQYAASGSGFIVTADGYILTNYHVVEGSSNIQVALYSGDTYSASLIGYDSDNDIAILKIDATDLKPVTIGNSDDLKVGEEVYAIGNPLGELTFSMTRGIVSALNREVTLSTGTMKLIQTDCSINSGNSGGALFNQYGEVVGITNAKYSSSSSSSASIDNICFAIPMNNVLDIVESLVTNGTYEKPYIGVTIQTASDQVLAVAGLQSGALVQSVTEGGPAAEAGLQENDIVFSANDKEITSSQDLVDYISACEPGDTVVLGVYRSGQTGTVTLTVGSKTTSTTIADAEAAEDPSSQNSTQESNPFGYGQQGGTNPSGSQDNSNGQSNSNDPFSGSGSTMEDFFNYYFGNR